jgi:glycosyltransferase involved in cell wall biosynthesis
MRIGLVHPTYWPEVRRGSERIIHDLAAYLAGEGHEVTILTAHRGRPSRRAEDGFTVVRGWRPPARLNPRGAEPHLVHAPLAALATATRRLDVVHALHIGDAWGASWLTGVTRRPLVLSLMGYPDRESLDAYRFRRAMLMRVAARASAVHTLSEATASALRAETGIEAIAIQPGTDIAAFQVDEPRDPRPTVLCAASPTDPRKRVPLLVEAFSRVRRGRPDARLVIHAGRGADADGFLRADGVELVADTGDDALAVQNARAWTTVLPSSREAFGLVVVESLAAGTPVVGMNEGGVPEILDSERVGVLCESAEPGPLAEAIDRGLELGADGGVRAACREHAERWAWSRVGPRFEALYQEVAGAGRPR